tara:strand:- start:1466 stop:3175 length:1710 start_codon:yes stop_codon:yes gene_type:complete
MREKHFNKMSIDANKRSKAIVISDFTVDNFSDYLDYDTEFPLIKSITAPFDQVIQVLIDQQLDCWENNLDFAVVWTRPESIIEPFNQIINYKNTSIDEILNKVDEYSSLLLNILDRVTYIFIPIWVYPSYQRDFVMLDMKNGVGISNTLMRMNLRLAENLERESNIYLLDIQRWINIAGKHAFNPKLWYMGKIAFGNEVFIEAVKDIKCSIRGITGYSRKLIILDLDDTLWGGIVGDVGLENIRLGGHNPIGEAFVDFQKALKSLINRGIILGIVSKNEESIAIEAINKHPEMQLKLDDFSGWRINWEDKAQNIVDLVADLNLGLQSVVFIDDSPIERARIRDALPEVYVPEWPEDKMLYKMALQDLRCFSNPIISQEDSERTTMYVSERKRKEIKKDVGSLDEWLKKLKIKVEIEEISKSNLQRTIQLLNKTNQMNLTTRRLTESELLEWAKQKKNMLWTIRVSDKFGDSGLTGVISLKENNKIGIIVDFVLSCRVFGRKIEETMIYAAIDYAKSKGLSKIIVKYIPTKKNKPCLDYWENSPFECNEKDIYSWDLSKPYYLPDVIELI